MRFPSHTVPWAIGLALSLVIILFPVSDPPPERDLARDIASLRQAECEYRGITSTFEELTRVYVLQTYDGSELVRWEGRPSPQNPASEALVTGIFEIAGVKNIEDPQVPEEIVALRTRASSTIGVTWRYSTLAAVRITAANDFAVDALAVFQQTVDGFISQMVFVPKPAVLRQGPGADFSIAEKVEAGTVLLVQPSPQASAASPSWKYVRIPSTPTFGWIAEEELITVEHDKRQ